MTAKERRDLRILNGSRRLRIASGSGTQVSDVNKFVKQFEGAKKDDVANDEDGPRKRWGSPGKGFPFPF